MKFALALVFACALAIAHGALITVDQFKKCVQAKGNTPNDAQAHAFIDQAEKVGGINSKREAFMAVAQMAWESDGFKAKEEYGCQGKNKQPKCSQYTTQGCPKGKLYYGRGYIQLTHCYNYKNAANALNDQRIVNDPDIVARDERLAMGTALWYWKNNVHNAPGVQQGHFGAATKAINGALECKGDKSVAKQRFQLLQNCLKNAGEQNLGVNNDGC